MRNKKRMAVILLVGVMVAGLTGCGSEGSKNPAPSKSSGTQSAISSAKGETESIRTSKATYDEMVNYLKKKGFISKDVSPVDINKTKGYLEDHTGGKFTETAVADKADDYSGLWLFWWDPATKNKFDETLTSLNQNSGTIVLGGGAAVLTTQAHSGAFAIAFSKDYAQKDAALSAFQSLSK